MAEFARKQNYYLKVGYKVQLKPGPTSKQQYLVGRLATITRIEEMPPPLDFQTDEEWEDFLRIRQIHFWVRIDDLDELPDYYRDNEVFFHEDDVRLIPPRMTEQQLLQFCEHHSSDWRDPQRGEAYHHIFMALKWKQISNPFITYGMIYPIYPVDPVNRFRLWAAEMRKSAQEMREQDGENKSIEGYETHAEVCEEVYQRLLPKRHASADPSAHRQALLR